MSRYSVVFGNERATVKISDSETDVEIIWELTATAIYLFWQDGEYRSFSDTGRDFQTNRSRNLLGVWSSDRYRCKAGGLYFHFSDFVFLTEFVFLKKNQENDEIVDHAPWSTICGILGRQPSSRWANQQCPRWFPRPVRYRNCALSITGRARNPPSAFQDCYFCKIRHDPLFSHGPDRQIE